MPENPFVVLVVGNMLVLLLAVMWFTFNTWSWSFRSRSHNIAPIGDVFKYAATNQFLPWVKNEALPHEDRPSKFYETLQQGAAAVVTLAAAVMAITS